MRKCEVFKIRLSIFVAVQDSYQNSYPLPTFYNERGNHIESPNPPGLEQFCPCAVWKGVIW